MKNNSVLHFPKNGLQPFFNVIFVLWTFSRVWLAAILPLAFCIISSHVEKLLPEMEMEGFT